MPPYLLSKEAFAEFLGRFATGELPRAEWNHAAHLAVAAATIHSGGNIRDRILAYNATQGIVSTPDFGYHETITRFSADRIQELMQALGRGATDFDVARAAVAAFAHRGRLFDAYYSFDLLTSREARAIYVPADK